MFTGLVEAVGEVADIVPVAGGMRLRIRTPLAASLQAGESLAVNGVCLTATSCEAAAVSADLGPETASVTTLGSLRRGQGVNLERPMRADSRFGGHFVLGHVDGTGAVESVREAGDSHWITVKVPLAFAPMLISKGSVTVDGVSLTVARLAETTFDAMIIPFTWTHTTLSSLRVGDRVNIECDVIGKYVARSMELAAQDGFVR